MPLTGKQSRVLDFIRRYIESNGEAPTIAEIGRQFQMTSSASVHAILTALENEGLITRTRHIPRGITVVDPPRASAGQPVSSL